MRWLEIGCGRQIVPEFAASLEEQRAVAGRAAVLIGIDMDPAITAHPLVRNRVFATAMSLPFEGETFDLVTANMVVEHIADPGTFLREVRRVLRTGGRLVFHTPNRLYYLITIAGITPKSIKGWVIRKLESRSDEDQFETYYRMNSKRCIAELARETGFEMETALVKGSVGSLGVLGPIGWLECPVLKLVAVARGGEFNSNLIVSLRRPAEARVEHECGKSAPV